MIKKFEAEWDALLSIFEKESSCTSLPESTDQYEKLNKLLLKMRAKGK